MPLFRRPDGALVRNESRVRLIIPYLMPTRTESAVYHEDVYDLTRARPWLAAWNRGRAQPATLFHLFLWACARALHTRSGLNRFVSGGRIYQRDGVQLSFAAKRQFRDDAPLVTVKSPFPDGESFADCVARLHGAIGEGRSGKERAVDKELKLGLALPGWLLRMALAAMRWLDRMNLLPGAVIAGDPMYASLFAANLGSIGIDDTYHHLFEYGTISLFAVLGVAGPRLCVDGEGRPAVRDAVQVRWTFDERIHDGFYCAASLAEVRRVVEDPEQYAGPPPAVDGSGGGA
jgi:hypothetical protein